MISLIVCSINESEFNRFSNSVSDTIGVQYEIIRFENSIEKLSIAKSYNKASLEAKFEILVFVHEDVVFHTIQWGEIVANYFKTLENPGVLGVAGSSYVPITPSDWWIPDPSKRYIHLFDNHKKGIVGKGKVKNHQSESIKKVFALDGLFLAIKKEVFIQYKFDESLPGFHGYDTSICLRISKKYNNYFIPGISIEHFSPGSPNSLWLENTIQVYLNHSPSELCDIKNINLEVKAFQLFNRQLVKFSPTIRYKYYWSFFYFKKLIMFNYKILFLWMKYQIIFLIK